MATLEVFFDMTCPYCYRAHSYLTSLLPEFPGVQVEWRPIEAHPKIEEPEHKPYVDLAVQGALYVKEKGGDALAYVEGVFKAYFEQHQDVEDVEVLAAQAEKAGVARDGFAQAVKDRAYEKEQRAANDHAYEEQKVWAVPTYVGEQARLDAVGGVGVTKDQVRKVLEACAG